MSEERKRPEKKTVLPIVSKKRDGDKEIVKSTINTVKKMVVKTEDISQVIVSSDDQEVKSRTKTNPDKYLKLAENASMEDRKFMNDRVLKGELSPAYYAIDGDKSYHYFLIIKKM